METTSDIRAAVNAELDKQAESNPALTNLSTSQVAEWKGLREVFVHAAWQLLAFFRALKNEILAITQRGQYGTQVWWKQAMLEYQDGDPLPEGKTKYDVIDLAKRIITRCSITKNAQGTVVIKVAKASGELSPAEFSRANDYVTAIKPFCTDHALFTSPADQMKCIVNYRYDGKLVQADELVKVQAAINGYLANVDFDGVFNVNRFRDALEVLSGRIDVDIAQVQIRANGGTWITVLREYTPFSGYYTWLQPDSTINMIPA